MPDEQKSVLQILVELRDEVTEPLQKMNEQFESFSENIHGLWAAGAEVFGGYEAIEGLLEPAVAFAQVQERLALAMKGSSEELAKFKEQAEDLSENFPKNIEDITAAQTELYQTFRNLKDTEDATEVATKLATALGTDAATGANILSSAIENLGEKGKPLSQQLESLGDKLAILRTYFPSGAAGAQRMAIELSRLGAAAQTTGIHQNQIFAVWAELNRLHAGGGRGSGQLAEQIIQSLTKLNDKGVPELEKFGLAVAKAPDGSVNLYATLKAMSEMSPKALQNLEEHMSGQGAMVALLVKHISDVNNAYGEFLHHEGALQNIADAMSNTPEAKLERLRNTIANLGDTIGTQMLPQLIYIVDRLSKFVHAIDDFLAKHPQATKAIGELAAGLASVLTLAGLWKFGEVGLGLVRLTANVSGLVAALDMLRGTWAVTAALFAGGMEDMGLAFGLLFESNPLGWILTAVAAIAFLSYEVWKHWDDITKAIHYSVEGLKDFVKIASGLSLGQWGDALSSLNKGSLIDKVAGFATSVTLAGAANIPSSVSSAEPMIGHTSNSSSEQHLHYAPSVTVNVGQGVDERGVGSAVHQALSNHADELARALKDQQHEDRRTSFHDPTLAGAH